jgi:hypothetical protein
MANAFKNRVLQSVGTVATDVGAVVASSTETTLIGMTIANRVSSVISVDVQLHNGSASTYIVKAAPIPVGGSLIVVGGDQKIVLNVGHKIIVTSNTASSADVIMSFLEIT